MAEEINFWYINKKDYSNFEFMNFKKEFIEDRSSKFIQLYVNNKPVLIAGKDLYHRQIFELFLKKFNINFETRLNRTQDKIPVEEGDNYRLVGAGRVRILDDKLNFYDSSTDYIAKIDGVHRQNLEDIFGLENLEEGQESSFGPSFFVNL